MIWTQRRSMVRKDWGGRAAKGMDNLSCPRWVKHSHGLFTVSSHPHSQDPGQVAAQEKAASAEVPTYLFIFSVYEKIIQETLFQSDPYAV